MKIRQVKIIAGKFFVLSVLMFLVSWISCSKEEPGETEPKDENNKTVWVFLMAGQSNMAGRGAVEAQDLITNNRIITINSGNNWITAKEPLHFYEPGSAGLDCGLSFAKELLNFVPDSVTIAMVPCAVGGSSVFQWLNDEEHRSVKLLSNFKAKAQLSKKKGTIKGILWHQGERNANETDLPEYEDTLLTLFSKFRTSVADDELPIILGEIGRFAEPEEKAAYFEEVNQIIRKVAEENSYLFYISSEGLEDRGDNLHFNSEGQRELGRRYAEKYIDASGLN
ncbi:sialate O-acetylesterase [Maribellus comscasis]|nr:sialate O-acetylesterase [Maribellus comscasis]